jgi:hypothetical protein
MKSLSTILTSLLLAGCVYTHGASIDVISLSGNGRLSWTNSYPDGLYNVEWAPSVTGPWKGDWTALQGLVATSQTSTVAVPMFYRVKCATNLFMPFPTSGYMEMSRSNFIGQVSTQRMTAVASVFLPSKGKEFTLLEGTDTRYPPASRYIWARSTTNAMYGLDEECGVEELWLTNAPVGTSWTDTTCDGYMTATIEAYELVTVPAGTFLAFRLRKASPLASHPNPVWYEWWTPGVGQVKWVDYYVDPSENPPIVYEMLRRGLGSL